MYTYPANFNPRSPCGERPDLSWPDPPGLHDISIHAPRVGSDGIDGTYKVLYYISIHAPRVGSDGDSGVVRMSLDISIHAPRVGSDVNVIVPAVVISTFQSTLPVWGATGLSEPVSGARAISIHAPRVGSDPAGSASPTIPSNFNPRSPCGERRQTQIPRPVRD